MGERIKQIRGFFKLDQREFAKRLGVSWQTISAMERETKKINADLIVRIEEVFNADSGWILNGRGNPFLPNF